MRDEVLKLKQEVVDEIVEKINRAQSVVLVDYRGLNVDEVNQLRSQYRSQNVDYKVYKNTMMRRAFDKAGVEGMDEFLVGPNAVAFSYDDPVSAAKVSQQYAKENEKLVIKAGLVDGKPIDVKGIISLAKLPSREVLIAQALGGFNAPIQGLANVMQGTISGFVRCLNQVREQKEAQQA